VLEALLASAAPGFFVSRGCGGDAQAGADGGAGIPFTPTPPRCANISLLHSTRPPSYASPRLVRASTMPIYEFACPKCRVIFNFLSKRVSPDRLPVCPSAVNKKWRSK